MDRILITGAAGALGRELRRRFHGKFATVRLSDAAEMAPARAGEEVVRCDLSDAAAVDAICNGVEAVVHLGGQSIEAPWPRVIQSNILGAINLWEGARKGGVRRVLFASSNHAIGFYRRTQRIDHRAAPRPDTRYGLSKAFGEDLAVYYAYKHGIAGFCMRIGSCFEKPKDARMLSTWLSYDDFEHLVRVGLTADYVYEVVYGQSRNTRGWWDNSNALRLGFDPKDDAEKFTAELAHLTFPNAMDEAMMGGAYCSPDFTGEERKIP